MTNAARSAEAQYGESNAVLRHESKVAFLARQFADSGVPLEDLLQEGREALLVASRTWLAKNDANLWSYAHKSVYGAMCNLVSKETRLESDSVDEVAELDDGRPSAASDLEHRECVSIMVDELSMLAEAERRILRLRFVDGLGIEALAAELNLSVGGAHGALTRALAALRERVEAAL